MPALIWNIQEFEMAVVIATLSLVGWVIVFTSTFLNNHFELSGLHQVANNLVGGHGLHPRWHHARRARSCRDVR
jgi:methanethiol S-methyltransferase